MKSAKFFIAFTFLLAFAFQVSAQKSQYPNEIIGYRFFNNGKLKTLRLGYSTVEDVKKLFGADCVGNCNYDADWQITFEYLKEDDCFSLQSSNESKKMFCPRKEYVGRLASVELRPKRNISFAKLSFQNFGSYGGGTIIGESPGKGNHITYKLHSDSYGLSYLIFDEVSYSTEKNPTNLRKGDLLAIKYVLSDTLIKKIFTEKN